MLKMFNKNGEIIKKVVTIKYREKDPFSYLGKISVSVEMRTYIFPEEHSAIYTFEFKFMFEHDLLTMVEKEEAWISC